MTLVNKTHEIDVPITTKAGAYTAGDVIGGRLDLTALCGGGGGGVIRAVIVSDDANQQAALDLHLFSDLPTEILDDAAFATGFTFADLAKRIKKISIAALDYEVINSNAQAIIEPLSVSHGSGKLYGYLVANGSTPTYGASSAVLKLKVIGWKD
jgi:hypothetical protein